MRTIRQDIMDLLSEQEMSAMDLSQALGIAEKEVYPHLTHIARSAQAQHKRLKVRPARCLACGYVFEDRKRLTPPGRCPRCKQSHLQRPTYRIDPNA